MQREIYSFCATSPLPQLRGLVLLAVFDEGTCLPTNVACICRRSHPLCHVLGFISLKCLVDSCDEEAVSGLHWTRGTTMTAAILLYIEYQTRHTMPPSLCVDSVRVIEYQSIKKNIRTWFGLSLDIIYILLQSHTKGTFFYLIAEVSLSLRR